MPFFDIDPETSRDLNRENVSRAYFASDIPFLGFGETAFYREPLDRASLASSGWHEIFQFSQEENLIIMIHLRRDQADELRTMLRTYPDTRVLLHGPEIPNELPALLQDHQNLYYTLDTATLLISPGRPPLPPFNLMYPDGEGSASQFVNDFERHRDALLDNAIKTWSPVIRDAPNQVLWGTDVSLSWHIEREVYSRLITFSNDFISIGYKYRNTSTDQAQIGT